MGKALMGTYTTPRSIELLEEVRALRARVAQLESALAAAEAIRDGDEVEVLAIDETQREPVGQQA